MSTPRLIVVMWLVSLGIVTYGHYRNDGSGIPPASGYFGSAVTYSLLSGLALVPGAAPLAGVFAVAFAVQLYWRTNGVTASSSGDTTLEAGENVTKGRRKVRRDITGLEASS